MLETSEKSAACGMVGGDGVHVSRAGVAIMRKMGNGRSGIQGRVSAGVLVAAVACSALLLAQAPPDPPPSTVGQIGSGAPQPTFRAGVTLVTTDVIVRNQDGVFMSDFTKDDFRVLEDGIEQEIVSLVLVHGGRVFTQLSLPAPVQEGIVLPSSRPTDETAGRIFVLFVDDLHLVTNSTPKVRQVFEQIADTLVHEGDLFGIISTGPSSLSVDMTYDRSLLYSAMERIMGDGFNVGETIQLSNGAGGPAELRYRAHVAFKTARSVLHNLEQVTNRRKVFIYLSNGYDFNPFAESRQRNLMRALGGGDIDSGGGSDSPSYDSLPNPLTDPFGVQGQAQFSDTDLANDLAELARAANRANTSFYTFDPRGLVAGPDIDLDIQLGVSEWNDFIFKSQSSLRMLAEMTGGMAVVNRNDFSDALRQIDAETSDYYILGFYSGNPDPTVRTRRLEVQIVGREDEDIDVRSRTHYSLPRGPA